MHSPRFGVYLCFSLAFGLAPLRAQDATKLPNIPKGLHLTTEDRSLWLTEIGDFILGGKTHMPSELRLEWAVLLFSLPECKRFLRPDARFLSLLPDAEKSPLLPGNTRWFYLALLSGPELRHRATGITYAWYCADKEVVTRTFLKLAGGDDPVTARYALSSLGRKQSILSHTHGETLDALIVELVSHDDEKLSQEASLLVRFPFAKLDKASQLAYLQGIVQTINDPDTKHPERYTRVLHQLLAYAGEKARQAAQAAVVSGLKSAPQSRYRVWFDLLRSTTSTTGKLNEEGLDESVRLVLKARAKADDEWDHILDEILSYCVRTNGVPEGARGEMIALYSGLMAKEIERKDATPSATMIMAQLVKMLPAGDRPAVLKHAVAVFETLKPDKVMRFVYYYRSLGTEIRYHEAFSERFVATCLKHVDDPKIGSMVAINFLADHLRKLPEGDVQDRIVEKGISLCAANGTRKIGSSLLWKLYEQGRHPPKKFAGTVLRSFVDVAINSGGVVGHNATLKVMRAVVYVKDRALLSTLLASVDKVLESELDAPRRTRAERVKIFLTVQLGKQHR